MTSTAETLSHTISLNGEPATTRAATLAELLAEQGYGDRKVATAVNGSFVPERARGSTRISPGDRIEVLAARQGG